MRRWWSERPLKETLSPSDFQTYDSAQLSYVSNNFGCSKPEYEQLLDEFYKLVDEISRELKIDDFITFIDRTVECVNGAKMPKLNSSELEALL